MDDPRYYFSTDGRDSYGPVTVAALRQLFADGVLTGASFLRPEQDTEWQAFDVAFFAAPAAPAAAAGALGEEPAGPAFDTPAVPRPEPEISAEPDVVPELETESAEFAAPPASPPEPELSSEPEDSAPASVEALEPLPEPEPESAQAEPPTTPGPVAATSIPSQLQLSLDAAPAPAPAADFLPGVELAPSPKVMPVEAQPETTVPPLVEAADVEPEIVESAALPDAPPAEPVQVSPAVVEPEPLPVVARGPMGVASAPFKLVSVEPEPETIDVSAPPSAPSVRVSRIASILAVFALVDGLLLAIWLSHRAAAGPAHRGQGFTFVGSFAWHLLLLLVVPCLIAFAFPRRFRPIVVIVAVCLGAVAAYFTRGSVQAPQVPVASPGPSLQQSVIADARNQIQKKGYYEQDPQKSAQQLQQLKDQVGTDSSESARISRDELAVIGEVIDRTKVCDQLAKACNFDVLTITGLGDIADRESALEKLNAAQQDVVAYLQNIDGRCRVALAKENLSPAAVAAAVSDFRRSGQVDLLVTLWQAQAKLSSDHVARLDFLAQNWGKWSVRNGKLAFPDQAALDGYNAHIEDIKVDADTIKTTQKEIYR